MPGGIFRWETLAIGKAGAINARFCWPPPFSARNIREIRGSNIEKFRSAQTERVLAGSRSKSLQARRAWNCQARRLKRKKRNARRDHRYPPAAARLGYMLALAGYPLVFTSAFLDPSPESSGGGASPRAITAQYTDRPALKKICRRAGVGDLRI